jgi:hypothetical protein
MGVVRTIDLLDRDEGDQIAEERGDGAMLFFQRYAGWRANIGGGCRG